MVALLPFENVRSQSTRQRLINGLQSVVVGIIHIEAFLDEEVCLAEPEGVRGKLFQFVVEVTQMMVEPGQRRMEQRGRRAVVACWPTVVNKGLVTAQRSAHAVHVLCAI